MRTTTALGIFVMSAGMAWAQAPVPAPASKLAAGTRVDAQLKTKLDTKQAQVGDTISAVTTADVKEHGVKVLPKGSTLTGHVTEVVAAESKKSPSRIGVLFDAAVTKEGQPVALRAGIASVFANSPPPMPMDMGNMALPTPAAPEGDAQQGNRPGMDVGGVPPPVVAAGGSIVGSAAGSGTEGTAEGLPVGMLGTNAEIATMARASNGAVIRVQMPPISATASQQTQMGSVLSSSKGDLQLNSGTRVELEIMN